MTTFFMPAWWVDWKNMQFFFFTVFFLNPLNPFWDAHENLKILFGHHIKYRISSYKTRGSSTAGIIRTQVLIEGWYYYQKFINLDIKTRKFWFSIQKKSCAISILHQKKEGIIKSIASNSRLGLWKKPSQTIILD